MSDYSLFPKGGKQWRFINESNARLNIAHGAVRSAKTLAAIDRFVLFVTNPNRQTRDPFTIMGKTATTIRRNMLNIMERKFGSYFKYSLHSGQGKLFGRDIEIIGVNDERSAGKIKGLTSSGILADEITTWPKESFYITIQRISTVGAKMFATTNPDNPYHWLNTEYLNKEGTNLYQLSFELDDNPFLEQEYIDDLKAFYKDSKLLYDRYIRGLWVAGEGAIYDMFNEEINIKECNLINNLDLKIGLDYGTTNPLAAVATIEQNDVTYVISELHYDSRKVGIQKTDSEYVELIKQWISKFKTKQITFVIDPSATSFITAMKRANFHVINANNSVREGITLVSEKFLNKTLFISKECPILIANIKNYSWDDKAIIRGVEQPIKRDDHLPDALRYAVNTEKVIFSFTPIERIRGY